MQTGWPLIGIPTPTSCDLAYNRQNWPQYSQAVRDAGGEPLELPVSATANDLSAAVQRCAGFVLPGSPADIDPELYGEDPLEATASADPAREACDRLILEHAEQTGKPIFGICFGLQSLNTWRGGTLVQDLAPVPVNHAAGSSVAVAHTALVASTSLLGSMLPPSEAPADGPFRRLSINSSHHQAVSRPGDDLIVVARCVEDGTVEALEGRIGNAPMLGVQWHPERSTAISEASRNLFRWLTLEALDAQENYQEELRAHAL